MSISKPSQLINSSESGLPKSVDYGSIEKATGVGINRELMEMQTSDTPRVYFGDMGRTVTISIEEDPELADFLFRLQLQIAEDGSHKGGDVSILERVQTATTAVVRLTSEIDSDNRYHTSNEPTTLGDALNKPVQCTERALAIEAALKMGDVSDNAHLLPIKVYRTDGTRILHTDTIFTLKGHNERLVALSTGHTINRNPGEIIPFGEYEEEMRALTAKETIDRVIIDTEYNTEHFTSTKT